MEPIIIAIIRASIQILELFKWAIFARILLSWVQPYPQGKLTQFLYDITDPYLKLFRNIIPRISMIDFSPIIAFIVLGFMQRGLANLLVSFF